MKDMINNEVKGHDMKDKFIPDYRNELSKIIMQMNGHTR
jgi:hypothetical protein